MRRISFLLAARCSAVVMVSVAKAQEKDLIAEANAQAAAFWESVTSKCGDSYVTKNKVQYFEFKGVTFSVYSVPGPLSEADKLNGISWRGSFLLSAQAYRSLQEGWGNKSSWSI